jgi:hypothetical protein
MKANHQVYAPMKTHSILGRCGAVLLLLGLVTVSRADTVVSVNSGGTWIGFMNVFELPANGGAYVFGSGWGTADLDATVVGTNVVLTPNTSIDRDKPADTFWWVGGAGGAPNKNMDASYYVQDDTLAGQTVTFMGTCISNSLVSPYTSVAFIKDFVPDFSSSTSVSVPMAEGTPFSISLATTPGHHIQYGFETIGPDARIATIASLGQVIVTGPAGTKVTVDASKTWLDHMTVYNLPVDGGNYIFDSGWGLSDLPAGFSAGNISVGPNVSIYRDNPQTDTFWWQPDGNGNKNMQADFYVENPALSGQIVTFSGYVWTNTLVAPYFTTAFIKELDQNNNFALVQMVTNNLVGTNFTISMATSPGHTIQYGVETFGPNLNPTLIPDGGHVIVSSNPPSAGPLITSLPNPIYVNVSSNASIAVAATGTGLTYQWQKNGVNLTNGLTIGGVTTPTLSLTNVTGAAEANYSVVITDGSSVSSTGRTYVVVFDPANLSFDPHATLNGFVNQFVLNPDLTAGNYIGGAPYSTDILRSMIVNGVAYILPNTAIYDPNNAALVNPDGSPNRFLEQDWFIANDDLAGRTLTFNGYCPSNSVPHEYTASVWIEDFVPNFSSFTSANSNLVAGQPFSITLPTTPGDHIQYGIRLTGPDNSPTNTDTISAALVSVAPPSLASAASGNTVNLSFPSVTGHNYNVQYKTNLTDAVWQTLTTVSGTGTNVVVPDITAPGARFYRLFVQ